jgi:hypothetical protein
VGWNNFLRISAAKRRLLYSLRFSFMRAKSSWSCAAAHAAAEGESLTGMWAFYGVKSSNSFVTLPSRGAWLPCRRQAGDYRRGAEARE